MFGLLSSLRPATPAPARAQRLQPARAVVVATGTPPGSELSRARQIADVNSASVHVVAAADPRSEPRDLAVCEAAENESASLVVVGPEQHGRGGRSLAERVHDAASCAVLQVRNRVDGLYTHVVIGVDESSAVVEMTRAARYVAPAARTVEYLHAFQSPSEPQLVMQAMGLSTIQHYRGEAEAEARDRIGDLLADSGLEPQILRFEHGPAGAVLNGLPQKVLLVVHRGRSWLEHAVFGSVTRSALERCCADVLVV